MFPWCSMQAVGGETGIWQVVFHTSSGKVSKTVKEAHQLNYGINTTVSRILLRAPYHTKEAEVVLVSSQITFPLSSSVCGASKH